MNCYLFYFYFWLVVKFCFSLSILKFRRIFLRFLRSNVNFAFFLLKLRLFLLFFLFLFNAGRIFIFVVWKLGSIFLWFLGFDISVVLLLLVVIMLNDYSFRFSDDHILSLLKKKKFNEINLMIYNGGVFFTDLTELVNPFKDKNFQR